MLFFDNGPNTIPLASGKVRRLQEVLGNILVLRGFVRHYGTYEWKRRDSSGRTQTIFVDQKYLENLIRAAVVLSKDILNPGEREVAHNLIKAYGLERFLV